ncbi:MAG TPA: thymidine phosphorylase [candidate division Zixibacteria bacterium]|nr:thymidine phosphorylase [candidate division Zixibacteria bacterium]HER00533.1 thymidine phosphorylase [candidate division Zixibacteria bacterium]
MLAPDLIAKKRDGEKLSQEEIKFLVENYTADKIPDYQLSAFLMAAFLNGLDTDETFWLTEAMLHSETSIEFPEKLHPVFDKHSTGGVGDKISLTLSPLMASLGYNIAMLSGRGLGHTGGTLDKLESIPGLNPFWSKTQIKNRLGKCGIAISGQTEDIAPADKKIYALRDLTGRVESIPLITASILSKKLALKTDGIVFDIKSGSGAFMKTAEEARKLARSLLSVCKKFRHPAVSLLTDMSEPLGHYIGNYMEIIETVNFLKTGEPEDIREVTFRLAYEIARMNGSPENKREFSARLSKAISSADPLQKFIEFVKISGGDTKILSNPESYHRPKSGGRLPAGKSGYIAAFNTELIGKASLVLGAGRLRIEDRIDPMAGIHITKKIGQEIKADETLFELYGSNRKAVSAAKTMLSESYKIRKEKIASPRKIITLIEN